jgi:hypothetical protein
MLTLHLSDLLSRIQIKIGFGMCLEMVRIGLAPIQYPHDKEIFNFRFIT